MSIEVKWGNPEKTYTVFTFSGKWTWEDYYQSISDGAALIEEVPYTVNILMDMTDSSLLPNNLLSHSNSSMRQPPRDFDLGVIVTDSSLVKMVGQMLNRMFSKKTTFKVVKTLEDAHSLFKEHDMKVSQKATQPSHKV